MSLGFLLGFGSEICSLEDLWFVCLILLFIFRLIYSVVPHFHSIFPSNSNCSNCISANFIL